MKTLYDYLTNKLEETIKQIQSNKDELVNKVLELTVVQIQYTKTVISYKQSEERQLITDLGNNLTTDELLKYISLNLNYFSKHYYDVRAIIKTSVHRARHAEFTKLNYQFDILRN